MFQLGDEQFHLTAGDTIFIPRNVPHAPAQLLDTGKYLYLYNKEFTKLTLTEFFQKESGAPERTFGNAEP